ncbi:MAG: adenosine kinase [Mariprofundaceae bacterium]|nr:adenosine kinase [Mariprofundaceae bacterium]
MAFDVYGVGNGIMDLQVQTEDAFLQQASLDKGVMTLVDEEQQISVLHALSKHQINYCSGGSACNTMVGISDFGGKTAYACKVGNDEFGQKYLNELEEIGVATSSQADEGTTGSCVVLITPDAQRTMLTHLGISSQLNADDIDEAQIAQSKYVYIEGYLFTNAANKAAAYRAMELAQKHSVKIALTISDPFLVGLFRDEFLSLIEHKVDLLFCNLEEARALTNKVDPIDCASAINQHCKNVALTLGPNGSLIMHEGEVIAISSVLVDAIDTTGAGDMYAAGVLYGITNELSWKQAGHLGSHAAAQVVSQLGARLKESFTRSEIEHLLHEIEHLLA